MCGSPSASFDGDHHISSRLNYARRKFMLLEYGMASTYADVTNPLNGLDFGGENGRASRVGLLMANAAASGEPRRVRQPYWVLCTPADFDGIRVSSAQIGSNFRSEEH